MKKKVDTENDYIGIEDIAKFKETRRENDNELIKALKKLGNPNFLKTRFRSTTVQKYRSINGKFFGVMC